jgi:hypothetical protein
LEAPFSIKALLTFMGSPFLAFNGSFTAPAFLNSHPPPGRQVSGEWIDLSATQSEFDEPPGFNYH